MNKKRQVFSEQRFYNSSVIESITKKSIVLGFIRFQKAMDTSTTTTNTDRKNMHIQDEGTNFKMIWEKSHSSFKALTELMNIYLNQCAVIQLCKCNSAVKSNVGCLQICRLLSILKRYFLLCSMFLLLL